MDVDNEDNSNPSARSKLLCRLVDNEKKPLRGICVVNPTRDTLVAELQQTITAMNQHDIHVGARQLSLWKISEPPAAVDSKAMDLILLAFSLNPKDVAEKLEQGSLIQSYFKETPLAAHLHIIVEIPNGSSSKRARRGINKMILACHFQFWGHRLDTALTTLPTYPSNEEDLSGDVLPGSPFLGVLQTPFLVRAEYIRVLNQVKAVCGDSCHKYLAEVTGQPGIGKTLWIYYALRYCLGEKQPVIWYRAGEFYFFSGGVEIFDSVHGWSPPFTWCFVDASAANRLPDKIYDPVNQLFPIYVTSPKEERWSKIQLRDPKLVVMNPWTKAELEKAATLYLGCKLEDISERLDNAGPSARLCLRYSQAQILDFYANRDASINFDTSRYMVTAFFNQDQQLRIGDVSHRLCVVRRSDSGSVPFILEPISAFIRHRLLTQLWYWEEQDRADMVKQFSRVPGTGGMIGLLFESHYQHEFAKKIDIFVTPMFRTADSRSRWHATFGDFSAAPMLYKACQEALSSTVHRPFSLSISPSVVRTYDRKSEVVIEENIYYVPLADNEVAIDSFIITAGHLYLFQFASGPEHSVKRGLLATLNRFSCLPPVANQHFIFVVPKHLAKFACPHSDDGFLRDHIPYVAQVTD